MRACFTCFLWYWRNNGTNNNNDDNNNNNNNDNNRIQRHSSRFFIQSPHCATNRLQWPERNPVQNTCNTSRAYHVQHVVLFAPWYEGTAQLLSLTELKLHLFELYFIGWTLSTQPSYRTQKKIGWTINRWMLVVWLLFAQKETKFKDKFRKSCFLIVMCVSVRVINQLKGSTQDTFVKTAIL